MDKRATSPVLTLEDLHLTFRQGSRKIHVLSSASGEVRPGETIALLGPSGAGKSSLLHVIGLLEQPDSGRVLLDGKDCLTESDAERTLIRRAKLGFIYQFHHLLPEFSALENVMLPQLVLGVRRPQARERAEELLGDMGLEDRLEHRPGQLSGGEQQRVAIARAVANRPKVLLADEPTGNLDPETAKKVFRQLIELVRSAELTVIIATHNLDIAQRMNRVWRLEDGKLAETSPAEV